MAARHATTVQTTPDTSDVPAWLEAVTFNADGLVPAIAQDAASGQVLMVAWMNAAALSETVATRQAVYFSRSRRTLWRKGESSGHRQRVQSIRLDCDGDVLLLSVEQIGGIACHTGRAHCFFRELDDSGNWREVAPVLRSPEAIYGSAVGGRNSGSDSADTDVSADVAVAGNKLRNSIDE
ncbi:MAG: phosphoribosyl-AMP cyclohydrolase [Gammaproteobacteria bacterium]|nr:MAG: phosphoribosyl-AMP cyclohydrolase [Gammaproteobacteria bacterium]PIE35555.1 MAG: phosphoribosyl-AMP cyclohydrolase [Gammaproteobacteria bacterium]